MDEDDLDDFSAAMSDVQPLSHKQVTPARRSRDPSAAQLERRDAAESFREDPEQSIFLTLGEVKPRHPLEVLEWRKDGIQLAVFNKLRKGGYVIERELDLHHHTVKESRLLVFHAIQEAMAKGQRCILISHGKGNHGQTPGRLKSYTAHWLIEHPEVLAYCSAERHRGGVGAVYVLVKKSAQSRELNRERHGLKSDQQNP